MPAPEISLLNDLHVKAAEKRGSMHAECVKARELLMHSLVAELQSDLTSHDGLDAVELSRAIAAVTAAGEAPKSRATFRTFVGESERVFDDLQPNGRSAPALAAWIHAAWKYLEAAEIADNLEAAAQRRNDFAY